jgi:hypothetical protein
MKTTTILMAYGTAMNQIGMSVTRQGSVEKDRKRERQARKFALMLDKVLFAYDKYVVANPPEELLENVFVDAVESGQLSYWAYITQYNSTKLTATLVEVEEAESSDTSENVPVYKISKNTVLRGLRKMQLVDSDGIQGVFRRIMSEEYDAADADLAIQFGIFGEEVYG